MNLIYLEYFIKVVESGSISRAAEVLLLKQSNLSKYIKALETEFGTSLFDRNYNGCTLTENGNKVFLWAKKCLEEKDSLIESFSNITCSTFPPKDRHGCLIFRLINCFKMVY